MIYRGRPLRFLGMVVGGWITIRVAMLWPETGSLPEAIRRAVPFAGAVAADRPFHPPAPFPGAETAAALASAMRVPAAPATLRPRPAPDPVRVRLALLGLVRFGSADPLPRTAAAAAAHGSPRAQVFARAPERAASPKRLDGSIWLLAREGGGRGLNDAAQLGGGQAGARLRFRLDDDGRLFASARAAAPLEGRGSELALGVEWRPGAAPIGLILEQRFGIDGARGGPALMAVGGIGGEPLGRGIRFDGYVQAGAVARDRIDPFVDGAARVAAAVVTGDSLRLDLGLGAWGAAQRDAARVDIGPSAGVTLPVAGQDIRLSLDWRHRLAGDARPGSGLALTVGTDF